MKKSVLGIAVRICFVVLVFFMLTIIVRFVTRQVMVERLGWDNAFTRIVFWGDEEMGNGGETKAVNWSALYPFQDDTIKGQVSSVNRNTFSINGYQSLVSNIEEKIVPYAKEYLFFHNHLTRAGKLYNNLIGLGEMPMNEDSDSYIILNNGYMTYTVDLMQEDDLRPLADSVADFSDYLKSRGIGLIYANAGSKICESDKQLVAGESDYINENADILIDMLRQRGVDVLDYRPLQLVRYPDWYSSYYVTDHHWKNTTGLWAAGELAAYLNNNYGFSFDEKYFTEDMYNIEIRDNYFLGGQGRSFTTAVADLEPFAKVTPAFDTDISISVPTRGVDT